MPDIIWANPAEIEFKISPFLDLPAVKGGDWDIDRRHEFKATAKYRAVRDRIEKGLDWRETDLFADAYARRMARDGRVGRCRSIEELVGEYERRIDALIERMKRHGFRTESKHGRRYALPAFLVGRNGETFIGNQGNHRLAIAQVLGLEQIAGKITCRHQLWTP